SSGSGGTYIDSNGNVVSYNGTGGASTGGIGSQTVANNVSDMLQDACDDGDQFSCDANQSDIPANGKLTNDQQDALGDLCDGGNADACNALNSALNLSVNHPSTISNPQMASQLASACSQYNTDCA